MDTTSPNFYQKMSYIKKLEYRGVLSNKNDPQLYLHALENGMDPYEEMGLWKCCVEHQSLPLLKKMFPKVKHEHQRVLHFFHIMEMYTRSPQASPHLSNEAFVQEALNQPFWLTPLRQNNFSFSSLAKDPLIPIVANLSAHQNFNMLYPILKKFSQEGSKKILQGVFYHLPLHFGNRTTISSINWLWQNFPQYQDVLEQGIKDTFSEDFTKQTLFYKEEQTKKLSQKIHANIAPNPERPTTAKKGM